MAKKRADKYDEKVSIKGSLDDVLRASAMGIEYKVAYVPVEGSRRILVAWVRMGNNNDDVVKKLRNKHGKRIVVVSHSGDDWDINAGEAPISKPSIVSIPDNEWKEEKL